MDLEMMRLVVSGAACVILAPASWCWPGPAYATDNTSPDAFGPTITTAGYFMVSLDPMLPSIHSMWPSVSTRARLVTRLNTLFGQFWMVVYVTRALGFTTSSTTAECNESVVYTGAEQPSM